MKPIEVKVVYNEKNNSIEVLFDDKEYTLVSNAKKELNAQEIFEMFNYEKDKKYKISKLDEYENINADYSAYLEECYNVFKNIIDGITIEEENLENNEADDNILEDLE